MRLVSPKEELAGKLAVAGRAASAKSTIQILSHVLLRAEDGRCELAATDMELSLRVPLEASLESPGAVVLPRLTGDIVRTMADGPVTLEHRTGEGIVSLTGGGSSFTLNCLQASDFPELPADEGAGLSMPAAVLVEAIDRVARAASRDETRPVLTGVLVRLGPDGLTMVATDSYRLAVRQAPLESPPADTREAIVPARALSEVSRLVGVAKADAVEVVLGESQALFRIGDVRLTSRIIEGQFPDHRQLVPDTFEHDVAFDRGELLGVLTRIGVLAQRNTPVRLAFEDGSVTISATSDQVGEGRESLPAAFSGDPLEIGFNVEFLRAGVESVDGDEVRLGLISPLRPGLLRGAEDDYRYLLMPIRLNA
ncbi:DNA polymerase III subunit beta [Miltoncostaea marina]|uniref:DNA polymerase III subunit beta n=1 Tax=Miltoncostaea marina TaxID=2843215 RepID=UPI001C3C8CC2|nr:DNA polymerase III subunit beta [Miltoncostaea marina]